MKCWEMHWSEPTVGKCNGLNLLHCKFIFADGTLRSEPPTRAHNNPQPAQQSHRLNDDFPMQMKCHKTRNPHSKRNAMAQFQTATHYLHLPQINSENIPTTCNPQRPQPVTCFLCFGQKTWGYSLNCATASKRQKVIPFCHPISRDDTTCNSVQACSETSHHSTNWHL